MVTPKKIEDPKNDVVRIARERFELAESAESDIRQHALDDLEFRAGKQWPDNIKKDRENNSRPCLTINRIPQFVRQVVNDQRQNRPSIKVSPVDDFADQETAKIYSGIIRHIEKESNADVAYDTAFQSAAITGFGYFRIITEFCDPMSFDLDVKIKRVKNQFSVYMDPHHKEPDGSDSEWAIVHEDISHEDFKNQYPHAKALSAESDWSSVGDAAPGWADEKTIRVIEYFYKEYKDQTIYQMPDGQIVTKEQLPPDFPVAQLKSRKSKVPVVKWCKLNGVEILEETEFPGRFIPIIPVYGDELDINGKRILEGVVRHAKDSQKMYNFFVSYEAEAIALSPKAPYIAAEGQITKELKSQWLTANSKTHAFLEYKPVTHNGQLAPPPQRNVFEAPVQAITNARMQASDDMKATTGIYDSALGAKGNEQSGIAIQRRNMQSQTSNFHLIDNLSRSIKHAGKILVEIIPVVFDTARAVRILGEEGEEEVIKINQEFERKGQVVAYDLNKGKYDVAVETGPGFATKRQEAQAMLMEFMKVVPQHAAMVADLVADASDWPGKTALVERLRKLLPPGLADEKDKQPIPPEVQAQMQQMSQQNQMMAEQLTQMADEMKYKKLELESRERIELMKIEKDYKLELLKQEGKAAHDMLLQEFANIDRQQDVMGMYQPIDDLNQPQMPDQQMMPEMQQQQPTGGFPPGNQSLE